MALQDDRFDLIERAEAALTIQDFSAALLVACKALEIARLGEDKAFDVVKALRLKALSLEGLGRREDAFAAWTEAKTDCESLGLTEGAAECDAHLKH